MQTIAHWAGLPLLFAWYIIRLCWLQRNKFYLIYGFNNQLCRKYICQQTELNTKDLRLWVESAQNFASLLILCIFISSLFEELSKINPQKATIEKCTQHHWMYLFGMFSTVVLDRLASLLGWLASYFYVPLQSTDNLTVLCFLRQFCHSRILSPH